MSFLHLAEIGLVMLLFTDASRTDFRLLRSIRNLPIRLLSTGMLLTIVLGAVGRSPGISRAVACGRRGSSRRFLRPPTPDWDR